MSSKGSVVCHGEGELRSRNVRSSEDGRNLAVARPAPSSLPNVSVVIPTLGRPGHLEVCLDSLAELDYPHRLLEVIVVEDGSSSRPITEQMIASRAERLNLKWMRQDHAGPAAARNRGAIEASGAYLAFTDDDCRAEPAWLRQLVEVALEAPEAVIGGRTVNAALGNTYTATSQILIDYIYDYYLRLGRPFFASNNLFVAREVWHRVGGFDTRFVRAGAEDRGFCDECNRKGIEALYAPRAVVRHCHVLALRGFWRQHFNYGRGAYVYHRTRPEGCGNGVKLEPLSFYLGILRSPFVSPDVEHRAFSTVLLCLSQMANAAGYFAEKLGSGCALSNP